MKRTLLSTAIASVFVAAPAITSAAESPYLQPDDSWVTLSGTVTSATADTFTLDYGTGLVTVEMDDWDWFEEQGELLPGDSVTVYGEVDDDTYESASIEANSVYVDELGTYFYASSADEEGLEGIDLAPTVPVAEGNLVVTGTITSVKGREFSIDSGAQEMKVDTALMDHDPTDDEGFQQVDEGDTVTVAGDIEFDTFEKSEIMADSVVTLFDDETS